ncbi:hypothetical protein FHS16_005341 [Paenibacillus endophyticus]|uniref:Uncharacterized protein n=1 Tax=Paenibacillus endophyticus TaxID=1294268 RepID=A0A7W5CCK7_9BACL|nr:hypothetical protein [Paenibacillus endophyticus]
MSKGGGGIGLLYFIIYYCLSASMWDVHSSSVFYRW